MGNSESALVMTVETGTKAIVRLTDVLTKMMGYWLGAGNGCSARCPITDMHLRVHQFGCQCVMYYWKYGQRSMVTISKGIIIPTILMMYGFC